MFLTVYTLIDTSYFFFINMHLEALWNPLTSALVKQTAEKFRKVSMPMVGQ